MIHKFSKKISIGTAQFGGKYGVANRVGEVSEDQVLEILSEARVKGIKKLDTAPSYGIAEKKLGKCGVQDFLITTKVTNIASDVSDIRGHVQSEIEGSLKRLGVNFLDTVLFHNEINLEGHRGYLAYQALNDLRQQGVIKKIGISTYFSPSFETILNEYSFQAIQVPYSIVDRRLESFNSRPILQEIDIQVRSIFLQGLLLMKGEDAIKKCQAWAMKLATWENFLNEHKLSAYEAALYFGLSNSGVSTLVVGFDSLQQLQTLCITSDRFNGSLSYADEGLRSEDENLLNPFAWEKCNE